MSNSRSLRSSLRLQIADVPFELLRPMSRGVLSQKALVGSLPDFDSSRVGHRRNNAQYLGSRTGYKHFYSRFKKGIETLPAIGNDGRTAGGCLEKAYAW